MDREDLDAGELERAIGERQRHQRREVEDYLLELIEAYPERAREHWDRDYSSREAYLASIEGNRERWRSVLGTFDGADALDAREEPFLDDGRVEATRLSIRLGGALRGRAILGLPAGRDGPHPLVICQHGYTSAPENVFGLADGGNLYHGYGYRLIEAGYAVLAPLNVTEGGPRNRFERLCRLVDASLFGLEVFRTRRLIDYLETREEIDDGRIGMWGLSMGGNYTLFALPAERRIRAGICSAFFNDRIPKMTREDPRFSAFVAPEQYEHMYLRGWLREFADPDLVSLICPRPFMVQAGEADGVAWPPAVREAFGRAREHYERLGIGGRVELLDHDGGHEVHVDGGIDFLDRHLR